MTAQDIFVEMESFTNEEKDIINRIASGDLEGITPEDLEVYTRYQTSKAIADESAASSGNRTFTTVEPKRRTCRCCCPLR